MTIAVEADLFNLGIFFDELGYTRPGPRDLFHARQWRFVRHFVLAN